MNHIEIERVHIHKLLGIHFTEQLNWNKHVNSITASSYSTIAVLRKLKHMAPYHLRKTLAESLILSKVDYGVTVFHPLNASELKRLQKCQCAAVSLVLGRHVKDPKDIKTLGWLSMKDRRDFHILQQNLKALYNKKWPEYLKRKQQTRNLDMNLRSQGGPRLQVPSENNTFHDNASNLFGNLPISIRNCNNFSIFSKLVKQYLANRDI